MLSDVQPDFPPQTVITGFPFYDRRDAEPVPPEVTEFLDAGEPPIVFTLGSSLVWVGEEFFQVSIEASRRLRRRASWLVGDMRNVPAEGLPDGMAAFEYAPVQLSDAASQCRRSSVRHWDDGQALRSGRPMLRVLFGQDQPDNARRCVKLGVARSITPQRYTPECVVTELNELLNDPVYTQKAVKVSERVSAECGTDKACDVIESVLAE